MIDTASFYNNEVGIGKGKLIILFLVLKGWISTWFTIGIIFAVFFSSSKCSILIHWPNKLNAETWRAFEHLYEVGKIKAIGVCNFQSQICLYSLLFYFRLMTLV